MDFKKSCFHKKVLDWLITKWEYFKFSRSKTSRKFENIRQATSASTATFVAPHHSLTVSKFTYEKTTNGGWGTNVARFQQFYILFRENFKRSPFRGEKTECFVLGLSKLSVFSDFYRNFTWRKFKKTPIS